MKNKEVTILLVEDDDVDAMGITRGFEKQAIANKIIHAKDGREALNLLQENQITMPYVILLDLNMPRMSGLEFLAELRKDETLRNSVVFILTTSRNDEDIVSSYQHCIAGYFLKTDSGIGFKSIVNLLNNYWQIVQLPEN